MNIKRIVLKANEKLICGECSSEILEGDVAALEMDWYRDYSVKVYCISCSPGE